MAELSRSRGGCHCGAVRFQVELELPLQALRCNCSMCRRTAFIHLIVPRSRFELLDGRAVLSSYRFNTGTAEHLFCRRCGVKSFYVPRSNPDGFSVNLRCLDDLSVDRVDIDNFDGLNWEAGAEALAHLSEES